jgi:hypothetical protein
MVNSPLKGDVDMYNRSVLITEMEYSLIYATSPSWFNLPLLFWPNHVPCPKGSLVPYATRLQLSEETYVMSSYCLSLAHDIVASIKLNTIAPRNH